MLIYKYQSGNKLKAVDTSGKTPVSTKAPVNKGNKTGLDWVAHKWETRDRSNNNNFVMDDGSGNYVDSGISPFDAILSAPQQVVKTISKLLPKASAAAEEGATIGERVANIITKTKNEANNTVNKINKLKSDRPKTKELGQNKFLSGKKSAKDLESEIRPTPDMTYMKGGKEYNALTHKEVTRKSLDDKINIPKNNISNSFKSEINWSKWNKEIPENKALINEYHSIERNSKANGTWMKNADNSNFQGTPEQFVQQQSSNFKKAFPKILKEDGKVIPLIHHSPNKFDFFDKGKNLSGTGLNKYGEGVYTIPEPFYNTKVAHSVEELMDNNNTKNVLTSYGNNRYDLYANNANLNKVTYKNRIPLTNDTKYEDIFTVVSPYENRLKSTVGNNGMFDMTNPNIYKGLIPVGLGATALESKRKGGLLLYRKGGRLDGRSKLPEFIKPYLNSSSEWKNGRIKGLRKPDNLKDRGVSMGADKNGFYIYTHRARSKSRMNLDFTEKEIKFIESTG